jgi:hypothetical protein
MGAIAWGSDVNSDDLRRGSLVIHKTAMHIALAGVRSGIELEHEDAARVFEHACKHGMAVQRAAAALGRIERGIDAAQPRGLLTKLIAACCVHRQGAG